MSIAYGHQAIHWGFCTHCGDFRHEKVHEVLVGIARGLHEGDGSTHHWASHQPEESAKDGKNGTLGGGGKESCL